MKYKIKINKRVEFEQYREVFIYVYREGSVPIPFGRFLRVDRFLRRVREFKRMIKNCVENGGEYLDYFTQEFL